MRNNREKLPRFLNLYLGKLRATLMMWGRAELLRISFSWRGGQLNLGFVVFITEDEHQERLRMEVTEIVI